MVTAVASFAPEDVARVGRWDTPHMARGIEFGVGLGGKPISNFPGFQTIFRPPVFTGNQRPRLGVGEVLSGIEANHEGISRVTVKVGTGTDLIALADVLRGVREITHDRVETVVASVDPALLRKFGMGVNPPDVLQQVLHWADPERITALIRGLIKAGDIADGAEVSFPIPRPQALHRAQEELREISTMLRDSGHDSHLAPVLSQIDTANAIGLIGSANFGASSRDEAQRLRGFYADQKEQRLDFDVPAAQFLGV